MDDLWGQIRFPAENGSDPGFNSRSDRFHPRMAWIYHRHRETVEGGAVSDCGVSAAWMPRPSPQGRVYGVPAIRHRPAKPTESPEPVVALAVASAGAGRSPADTLTLPGSRP
ncbi:hypothetical protein D5301_16230 [Stenotrophomonas sp. MH181796]|nr:hypothetical protein [Stenotrophomonas sp. MH181796]